MTTDAAQPLLELHVLSAGVGESIVLHLPNGEWGVVDCYASSVDDADTNAAIHFLKQRGVHRLEFLCLTHPHDDHYRGMSHFFDLFDVRYFWRFGGMPGEKLANLAIQIEGSALVARDSHAVEAVNDFQRTLNRVTALRKARSLRVKHMIDIQSLYPEPSSETAPFQVLSIAASTNQVETFEEGLKACFTKQGKLRKKGPKLDPNTVSAALLIRFGSTVIILGGDVEKQGWVETVRLLGEDKLAAHAVKVSHHGSPNGYIDGLWAAFARNGGPYAVITPFQKHRLPEQAAVEHIAGHARHVLTTCRPALSFEPSGATDFWEDWPLATRLALMSMFNRIRSNRVHEVGVCSLTFDDRGNCVSLNLSAPADRIAV
jgi:beta-lactamase superfamily II metal-dependent hydrolase